MGPKLRKFALTVHITSSVSWLGAVIGFLVLSITALQSRESEIIRGAYLSMNIVGLYAIVPLSFAALLTGLIQGVGTQWGLLRYYWVFIKFLLTIFATIALLLHQFTAVKKAAQIAMGDGSESVFPNEELSRLGLQLVGDASFAILVLLTAIVLSVYKPWGLTRYGRKLNKLPQEIQVKGFERRGLKIFFAVIFAIILIFILLHLAGGGLQHDM